MRLLKFLKMMFMVTVLALVYIHMQMQIFALAYQGKQKSNQITRLSEENSMIAYDILALKSSKHLGVKLLSEDSVLKFRDHSNVVQLVTTEGEEEQPLLSASAKKENPFLSLLTLRSQAEARTIDKRHVVKPWQRRSW